MSLPAGIQKADCADWIVSCIGEINQRLVFTPTGLIFIDFQRLVHAGTVALVRVAPAEDDRVSSDRTALRVLLADDHSEMLKAASSVLRETCDVVATVSDGLQAVEEALRLDPDVVVLDITMPGLDGFQAARELRRRGSQAKIVFLSLHEGDEFVATGFRSGGQAFVSKQRMPTDLPCAVEHVHAGRVFVPSLSSLSAVAPGGGHAVMFYSRGNAWCDEAAGLVRTALTRGDTVTVFAPEVTRTGDREATGRHTASIRRRH